MSTKSASSPSDIPSSGTCNEIEHVGDTNNTSSSNNPTQIEMTHSVSNKEIEKPATVVVADQPKANKHSSRFSFLSRHKNSEPKSVDNKPSTTDTAAANNVEPSSNDGDNNSNNTSYSEAEALRKLIKADLNSIDNASTRISKYKNIIDSVSETFKNLEARGTVDDYRKLKKMVKKLKQQISSKHEDKPEESDAARSMWSNESVNINGANAYKVLKEMPNLYKNSALERSLDFKEFEARYLELDRELKLCLLCFSVFPENVEIKKRVMIYWWIGEGFAPPIQRKNTVTNTAANTVANTVAQNTVKKTPEQFANEFFNKLIAKGFIEPVYKKRSLRVDICKMHPFVRSMVIKLAKRTNFFDFDDEGNPQEDYTHSLRACLKGKGLTRIEDLGKLHTLFNVNEAILDFKPEWFSKMKNVNVLYMGRWQTSPAHHIEVEDTAAMKIKNANVLDGLENITHLRFLSLQGISRVTELPESISKLTNLMILDIRACHNLEVIPNGIGLLKNLTHLDMSECYLLDQMPKGLASLSKLQVLSGFVVGGSEGKNSCTLDDLRKLTELRKLSIHTGVDEFPSDTDLRALNQFKALTKLTIAWGRGSVEAERNDNKKKDNSAAEQATAATKNPDLQRAPTRLSTFRQSTGTPNRENREGSKKKEIISAAEQAAPAVKKSKSLTRSLTKTLTDSFKYKQAEDPNPNPKSELPPGLIKLDLQCFPKMITPFWLRAYPLKNLKKLYIRGGKFSDLGQFQEPDNEKLEKDKWKVVELRLKYLTDLEMDWRELQELFPDLNYLEKVKCPKLTFFPCDESGVWMKKQRDKQQQQTAS